MVVHSRTRFFLISAIFVLGFLLFQRWQEDYPTASPSAHAAVIAQSAEEIPVAPTHELPGISPPENAHNPIAAISTGAPTRSAPLVPSARLVEIKTDVLSLKLDRLGGDIVQADLPMFDNGQKGPREDFRLLSYQGSRQYVAQSGLISDIGPDSQQKGRALFATVAEAYQMLPNQDILVVDLHTEISSPHPLQVTKRFTFYRGKYNFDVAYVVNNPSDQVYQGIFYGRLKRTAMPEKGGGFLGVQTYTGAAVSTEKQPYQKVPFKEIEGHKFAKITEKGGWIAMVEQYFLSAFIPPQSEANTYDTQVLQQNGVSAYGIQFYSPLVVSPHSEELIQAQLYLGPLITEDLQGLAPGLELTVDYGIFWPICKPIFWLLKKMDHLTGNWGVAIILTTLIIKLLFYKLSASSYRSMGNMKRLQPKIKQLKDLHGEDRQGFGQAMMALYRKERVNPLGGCLPIIVQIPVFIALYYVLLGSVELREAPFFGWIHDLSAKDPYFILPVLMGLTMLLQQRMNPAPPDPIQAKMMMFMPVVFTILFLQFPSGLVLYWVVNNLLSILQQWVISRKIANASASSKNHR
jgi:YidC/Oxa1 family membrane protein insertase